MSTKNGEDEGLASDFASGWIPNAGQESGQPGPSKDEDFCSSLTIELDDDALTLHNFQGHNVLPEPNVPRKPLIGKPLQPRNFPIVFEKNITISDLSRDARTVICSHFNLPCFGSLKNWESLASDFGMSQEDIISLRSLPRATESILDRFQSKFASELIRKLELYRRIDTLYSLKELILKKGSILQQQGYHSSSTACVTPMTRALQPPSQPLDFSSPYILVTHYYQKRETMKDFRWFKKNLTKMLKLRVVDIEDIAEEEDVHSSLQEAFQKATTILFCFSEDYLSFVLDNNFQGPKNSPIGVRRSLHKLADTEYLGNNCANRRFRPLLFPNMDKVDDSRLPVGWAMSTMVYRFPQDWSLLTQKLTGIKRKK